MSYLRELCLSHGHENSLLYDLLEALLFYYSHLSICHWFLHMVWGWDQICFFLHDIYLLYTINEKDFFLQCSDMIHCHKLSTHFLIEWSYDTPPTLFCQYGELFNRFLNFFLRFYLFIRERERAQVGRRGRRGFLNEQGAWCGAQFQDRGIMTQAQDRCLTDWATQAPQVFEC